MGRELKRVPLDFDWPQGEVWKGFINPHFKDCPVCQGSSYTKGRIAFNELVAHLMHSREVGATDLRELTTGLAGRPPVMLMHDAFDRWAAEKKIIEAAGLDPETWGVCDHCAGYGEDPSTREASEAWEPTEPPTGDGYQIWETVSEGSAISPVFATPEELASWMANKPWGADEGSSKEQWLRFINGPGWSLSLIMDAKHGVRTGVQALTDDETVAL